MDNSKIIEYIYTPYITLKNGKRIWAKQYGKKAFRIPKTEMSDTRK